MGDSRITKINTPISYYGGKQLMVRHILPLIPKHKGYIEPFCGGAAVFFAKELAALNVINDTNENIITFYRVAKLYPNKLIRLIDSTPYSMVAHKRARNIYRGITPASDLLRAWALFILSHTSIMSNFGSFGRDTFVDNTHAHGKSFNFNNKKNELKISLNKLSDVCIENLDALKLIDIYDHESNFMFIDPPYPDTHQGHYKGYTMADFERLLAILPTLKCKWMLTSYPNEPLKEFVKANGYDYREYNKILSAKKVEQNGTKSKKTETITMNYAPPQGSLF